MSRPTLTARPAPRRARLALSLLLGVVLAATVALVAAQPGETQDAVATPYSWPVAGLPGRFVTPLGAAPLSSPDEVLGIAQDYRKERVDGDTLAVGKMTLVRQRGGVGWETVGLARDRAGAPITFALGGTGPAIGHVTPRGGVVVAAAQRLLVRPPGGQLREIEPPGDALLDGRELIGGGRVTFAAADEGGAAAVFLAPLGPVEDRVLRHDGRTWTSEPVEVAGAPTRFTVTAIAVGPDGAYLSATDGTGVQLFRRDPDASGGPAWKPVTLTALPGFAATADARPLGNPAEGLTAVDGGLWLDGAVTESGTEYTFTLFVDTRAGRIARSWCNAPGLCDAPLEFELSAGPVPDADGDIADDAAARQLGYRSFAWPGGTYGTRVVTNPRVDGATALGSYGLFDGGSFRRVRASGVRSESSGQLRAFGAFTDATTGWLTQSERSLIRIAPAAPVTRIQAYPLPVRRPLKAVTPEPGRSPADPGASALAVGYNGQVLRYNPAQGWLPEPLPSGSGRATPQLNAVAWPELRRAHAVGERGEMWLYRAELGLWERDEGAPLDTSADRFVGIAFQPGNPDRGYAVAQEGRVLSYGKSWSEETVPSVGELFGVAFAADQALVVGAKGLLIHDGTGWRSDEQVRALLAEAGSPGLYSVAGLPDGGAVVAGDGIVLKRDSLAAPWRVSEYPLDGVVTAVSALRDGATVRAVAIVNNDPAEIQRQELLPIIDIPGEPPGIQRDRATWSYGSVFFETAAGWLDEERSTYDVSAFRDCPSIPESAIGMALDEAGNGWVVGGETGQASARRCELQKVDTTGVIPAAQTAQVWRYGTAPAAPPAIERVQPAFAPGAARLLFGGHAQCEAACAGLGRLNIGPDRYLSAAIDLAAGMHPAPGGPRALLYTGTRLAAGLDEGARGAELARYAELVGAAGGRIPTYVAASATDGPGFREAFTGLAAPQGGGAPGGGVAGGSGEGGAGAKTFFAMDTVGAEGTLRVVVVNNAEGSLEASAPGQRDWLVGVLDDARRQAIPAVVMGSRPLSGTGLKAGDASVATDAAQVAQLLVEHGASAYLFDSAERNVATRIPVGALDQIPAFGSGSLGYDQLVPPTSGTDPADNGLGLLEVAISARDPQTNRAPVAARVIPVLEDLAVDARDGIIVRRSSPALFSGLGRRPRAGHRQDNQQILAMDPYVEFPNPICVTGGCAERPPTEYAFSSSNPEIGDFVQVDPAQAQTNPRAVLLGPDDKPIADPTSSLFCAFNPGETTVSVIAGGLRYSTTVRVLAGSPRRPCGTRPVTQQDRPVAASAPGEATAPPVAAEAEANPTPLPPPPPVVAVPAAVPPAVPVALSPPPPVAPLPVLPPLPALPLTPPTPPSPLIVVPPPPVGGIARPTPPGGATVRVYEEKREEEEAFEQSSAASRYEPDRAWTVPDGTFTLAILIVAAAAGSTIARGRRRKTPGLGYAGVRGRP